jgi:hypothetical protein
MESDIRLRQLSINYMNNIGLTRLKESDKSDSSTDIYNGWYKIIYGNVIPIFGSLESIKFG